MDVVEDFASKPGKAVSFLVQRDKVMQVVRELNMHQTVPGFSGGSLPEKRKAERGTGGNDEEHGVRRVEKEVTHAVLTSNLVDSTASSVLAGELVQHVHQCWDCSH